VGFEVLTAVRIKSHSPTLKKKKKKKKRKKKKTAVLIRALF
jgi:hypothetical protein